MGKEIVMYRLNYKAGEIQEIICNSEIDANILGDTTCTYKTKKEAEEMLELYNRMVRCK